MGREDLLNLMTIHYHCPIDIDDIFVSTISTFLHAILYISRDFTTNESGNWILNVQWTISIFSLKAITSPRKFIQRFSNFFHSSSCGFFCSCISNRHEWVLIYYTLRLQSHNLHSWLLWIFIFFSFSLSHLLPMNLRCKQVVTSIVGIIFI